MVKIGAELPKSSKNEIGYPFLEHPVVDQLQPLLRWAKKIANFRPLTKS